MANKERISVGTQGEPRVIPDDTLVIGPGDNIIGKVKITDGTDVVDVISVDGYKGIVAISPGHISIENSSSDILSAGGVFTGISEDVTNFGVVVVTVFSNVASATDGLSVQQSSDGTNWRCTDVYSISANTSKTFSFQTCNQYFRVVYTNGASGQTIFDLQTVFKPYYIKPSSHRIQDSIIGDDDAELVKAVLTGLAPDGSFKNVLVTNSGNQKISIEEFENNVSSNNNSQLNTTLFKSDGTELNLNSSGSVNVVSEDENQRILDNDDAVTTINYTDSNKDEVSSIVTSSSNLGRKVTDNYDNSGATTLVLTRVVANV